MTDRERSAERGFTVLEAMISLSIFLVVVAGVLSTYTPSRRIYTQGERRADVQQNARLAMAEMARQIRMAGWFPENFTGGGAGLANPIRVATDGALAVYGDLDGSDASNLFLFCLDGTNLRRTRGAVTGSAPYTCANGALLAQNVTALRFAYYDENGDPVPNPPSGDYALDDAVPGAVAEVTNVAQRGAVRRVFIELTTERDTSTGPQSVTLTSDVALRNML